MWSFIALVDNWKSRRDTNHKMSNLTKQTCPCIYHGIVLKLSKGGMIAAFIWRGMPRPNTYLSGLWWTVLLQCTCPWILYNSLVDKRVWIPCPIVSTSEITKCPVLFLTVRGIDKMPRPLSTGQRFFKMIVLYLIVRGIIVPTGQGYTCIWMINGPSFIYRSRESIKMWSNLENKVLYSKMPFKWNKFFW